MEEDTVLDSRSRILAVLEQACRLGEDDPACTAAKKLKQQLQSRNGEQRLGGPDKK